jgi:hypothetical protein
MSEERLRLMGRLETEKLKAEELKLKMSGLVKSIRSLLDSYSPLELLECQVAAQQAMELAVTRHFPARRFTINPIHKPRRGREGLGKGYGLICFSCCELQAALMNVFFRL